MPPHHGVAASAAHAATDPGRREYDVILDQADFERWMERLEAAELVSFDTETTSLDYMQAEIVGVSFCVEPGRAAYVPLAHTYPGAPDQLDRGQVLARLKPLLEDDAHAKLGHHLKYDAHVLRNYGIELRGMKFDSMLESYVLDSTATRHDLDSTARHYLGIETIHYEDVAGKGAKQLPFAEVPVERRGRVFRRGRRRRAAAAPHALAADRGAACAAQALRGDRAAARARAARHGTHGRADRHGDAPNAEPRALEEAARAAGEGARGRGRAVQPRFAEAAAGSAVRQARPARAAQDRDRPALDRGGRARGTRRRVRAAAHHARLPRHGEAALHLHRQAAGAGRSAHRARAHLLPPGGGGDGTAVLHRPEPAEHPDPHARGTPHPAGLRRTARPGADRGRLFADRTSDHGAPLRRRRPAQGVRRGPRHPPGHRGRGVRRRRRTRSRPSSGAPPRRSTSG